MIQYTWNIDKVETLKFFGGQYNVVCNVQWHRTAQQGVVKTDFYGATAIPTGDLTKFTPYDTLTNDDIAVWLDDLVDLPWVNGCLTAQLQALQQPKTATISR